MKRKVHPAFSSMEGQRAHAHTAYTLQSREDLPAVTIRTSLSDLHPFRAWDESGWSLEQDKPRFPPQAVASSLLIRSWRYLQTPLWLKPSPVNRTPMSMKQSLAWVTNIQVIQHALRGCAVPVHTVAESATICKGFPERFDT